MSKKLYTIETGECIEDVENGCLIPSNGGLYTAENALRILENGFGGTMREVNGRGYAVSHIKVNNAWLRKELGIK